MEKYIIEVTGKLKNTIIRKTSIVSNETFNRVPALITQVESIGDGKVNREISAFLVDYGHRQDRWVINAFLSFLPKDEMTEPFYIKHIVATPIVKSITLFPYDYSKDGE